jgi:hypothetical protein
MNGIDWDRVFSQKVERNPGRSRDQLSRFVATVLQPLTPEELCSVAYDAPNAVSG